MKRPFLFLVVVLTLVTSTLAPAAAAASSGPEELGLELVPYAKKIGERRYQSQRDYDGTIKFFRDKWKNNKSAVRWTREVSLPGVKYIHLDNVSDSGAWEGVNIYQLKNGEVRFYVLQRDPKKAAAAAKPAAPTTTPATAKPAAPTTPAPTSKP